MPLARRLALVLVSLALVVTPLVLAALAHPTPIDWRTLRFDNDLTRVEALAGRDQDIRERDAAWNRGRTEIEFLAQYEKLRTQATPVSQGYRQGRSIGQQIGRDAVRARHGYRSRAGRAIASAQQQASAAGQPVDVIVG